MVYVCAITRYCFWYGLICLIIDIYHFHGLVCVGSEPGGATTIDGICHDMSSLIPSPVVYSSFRVAIDFLNQRLLLHPA